MPYDPYDSDDLIVIEVPTDIEDEDEVDDESDNSEESFLDYSALVGKRKRKIPTTPPRSKTRPTQVAKVRKPNNNVTSTTTSRSRHTSQGRDKATTSRGRVSKTDEEKAAIADSFAEVIETEENTIIETDLSMDADTVAADLITEDLTAEEEEEEEDVADSNVNEEKVFTELPTKYMLYDELVATIIGFDGETPIVEFTSITREEMKKVEKKLPVECGICQAILNTKHIAEHLKIHQNPETKRYNCIYCDNTHCNRNSAAAHSRRHLGIRPYACDICDNYFTTKNDLKLHYQRKHLEREFICEMCGKTYAQNTFLKRHIQSHHQGVRPHQCEYCPKSYHRKGNLKEHTEAVHMGNRKPLSCRFCGVEFRDSHKLARHRKEEHLNKSHFQCITCGVEFTDIQFFNAHKRSIQCRNNRLALKMDQPKEEEEPC